MDLDWECGGGGRWGAGRWVEGWESGGAEEVVQRGDGEGVPRGGEVESESVETIGYL